MVNIFIWLFVCIPTASYSPFPLESAGSAYSSYSSGYTSGYSTGYGGGYGDSSSLTQSKKNIVIKMIETKDGRVVSESSEIVQDWVESVLSTSAL